MVPRALVMDWGGVLTAPLEQVTRRWARSDGVDYTHFRDVLRAWSEEAEAGGVTPPSHRFERGELEVEQFERLLAAELRRRGSTVCAEGMIARMLSGMAELQEPMLTMVQRVRAAGVRTALLSNSWGEHYPEALWNGLFDVVVISGRVGMRKPEPRIYAHTVAELGLTAADCVMVDDVARNVDAAVHAGLVGVHHVSSARTSARIRRLFGLTRG